MLLGTLEEWLIGFHCFLVGSLISQLRFSLLSNYLLKHLDKQNIDCHTAESPKHVKVSLAT